jgi:hypothetical protein
MSDINQTLCFIFLIICLGGCFIWAFWEIEAARQRNRQLKQHIHEAMRTVLRSAEPR